MNTLKDTLNDLILESEEKARESIVGITQSEKDELIEKYRGRILKELGLIKYLELSDRYIL